MAKFPCKELHPKTTNNIQQGFEQFLKQLIRLYLSLSDFFFPRNMHSTVNPVSDTDYSNPAYINAVTWAASQSHLCL